MRLIALLMLLPLASAGVLPVAMDGMAVVPDAGGAFLVGGLRYTGSQEESLGAFAQDAFLQFTTAESYNTLPDLPEALGLMAAARTTHGLYAFGGLGIEASDRIYHYDFGTSSWSELDAKLDLPMYGMSAQAHNNKIYLVGGTTGLTPNQKIWEFSPASETMREIANFNGELRTPMPATAWKTNYMYIFGGVLQGDTDGAQVFRFDPVYETVEPLNAKFQDLRVHRMGVATAADYMYLIGGTDRPLTAHQGCMACGVNTHVYRYDVGRDALEIVAEKTEPLSGVGAAALGSTIFYVGGRGPVADGASRAEYGTLSVEEGFAGSISAAPGRDPGHVRISWHSSEDPFSTIRIEQWTGNEFALVKVKAMMDDEFVHVAQDWTMQQRYRVSHIDRNGTIASSAIRDVTPRDDTPTERTYPDPDAEYQWTPYYPQACTDTTFESDNIPAENIKNQTWNYNGTMAYGNSAVFQFDRAGAHDVTLTVMDHQNRTDTVTHTISATAGPPRGPNCTALPDQESPMGFLAPLALLGALFVRRFI